MYKTLKTNYRNWKLKNKLIKQNIQFNIENFDFKPVNVLFIDEIIPEFNKDSGSRRLKEIITLLLKNNIGVFLLADYKQYKYKSDYIKWYKEMGVQVYEPSVFEKKLVTKNQFVEWVAPRMNYAWLHRPKMFKKYADFIKQKNDAVKLIFDMCDFHYIRLLREWEKNNKPETKKAAQDYLKLELENCKKADLIFAISETDRNLVLEHYNQPEKFTVVSNIHQYFEKPNAFNPFEKRENILFIGNFRHRPNEDAVLFLHNKIMPMVWKTHPEIKVDIVGSYPTESVLKLNADNFKVLGFVDDVSTYFYNSRVFFAPLRYGAGIKGKIGQSLEYSLPIVTTDIGAEGFNFGNHAEAMIANDADTLSKKIIEMYTNKTLWNAVSDYSKNILQPFSIQETEATLKNLIN